MPRPVSLTPEGYIARLINKGYKGSHLRAGGTGARAGIVERGAHPVW